MSSDKSIPPQPLDEWFLNLLACPACPQRLPMHLNEGRNGLICQCGRYSFPINEDGIPVLLVDHAVLLDENAHPEEVNPPSSEEK